ncbi:uncharacterized protein [Musca autumnalis]|uniref:uncharacterized protein n=1 Tax=Musca autumnalis TaxID=221902 RepID=UPI003CF3BDEF
MEAVWEAYGKSQDMENPRPFYTACIVEDEFTYCIFTSQKSLNLIVDNVTDNQRKWLIDGTFSIVPSGCFTQMLVIYIEYCDHIFPIFFVLTDKKSSQMYENLFKYIKENVFDINPAVVIKDYEQGLRKALKTVFPNVKCIGCCDTRHY